MPRSTITSRELNQDLAAAKRMAAAGPVIITDRGEPAFVLMTYKDYQRLTRRTQVSLLDALARRDKGVELIPARGLQYERMLRFD